jgi:putative endonuclease
MNDRFYVYILECADGTYYIGSTNNLKKRIHQHNHAKAGAHYTKIRRPVVLKYVEELSSLSEARSREAELKRLKRAEKVVLIFSSQT